mmetsp:Transcript_27414/g.65191  ORF Transcript_27414/g.65191 Transcript_27414/m.65191 type:complete len:527 (-) Transcript_27414:492-2072(-)
MRLILLAALLGGVAADDSTCGETPLARSTASPSIEIDSSSNILDFLNEKVLEESVLADIRTNLVAGKVVLIRDAFKLEFAEWAHTILQSREAETQLLSDYSTGIRTSKKKAGAWHIDSPNREIERDVDKFYDPVYIGHHTLKHQIDPKFGEARAVRDMLNHNASRGFMSSISGRKCDGSDGLGLGLKFMEYSKGDHSNVHTDFRFDWSTNLIWYLSKDWKPEWGGSFYWANSPNTAASGYLSPAFNSLAVFVPNVMSSHIVLPVRDDAEGRRLSVAFKYLSSESQPFSTENPIEEWYGRNKEDMMKLTATQAEWIASRMNPGNATNLARRKKLEELKVSVRNYLRPFDDSVIIIEDPSLTEDEELLDEIRQNLLLGNLVVIEDAFKPEYAKHVMRALNDDELKWSREVVRPYHADVPGHVTQSNTLDKTSHADKVREALRPLDHTTSLEFFSSLIEHQIASADLRPSFFDVGDYSNPQSGNSDELAFIWHLSPDYKSSWGGALMWLKAKMAKNKYFHQSFNTCEHS